ncbi:MAG: 50S ribosomal protein L1, partial [Thermoplasmata archaeon]
MDKNIYEAVKKALESSKERKFVESVDLAINLKFVDLADPKKRINEEIALPNGRGKKIKVAVFASGDLAYKAKSTADFVIAPEEIDKLAEDKRRAKKLA